MYRNGSHSNFTRPSTVQSSFSSSLFNNRSVHCIWFVKKNVLRYYLLVVNVVVVVVGIFIVTIVSYDESCCLLCALFDLAVLFYIQWDKCVNCYDEWTICQISKRINEENQCWTNQIAFNWYTENDDDDDASCFLEPGGTFYFFVYSSFVLWLFERIVNYTIRMKLPENVKYTMSNRSRCGLPFIRNLLNRCLYSVRYVWLYSDRWNYLILWPIWFASILCVQIIVIYISSYE